MILGKVIGNCVSIYKNDYIRPYKLMVVQTLEDLGTDKTFIAVDTVCAGIGDIVLCSQEGGSARMAAQCDKGPVDASIIGVLDYPVS